MKRFLTCAALAACAVAASAVGPGYRLVHKYGLGGTGGWDYMTFDAPGRRLFITRGNRVLVFDPAKGRVVGGITHLQGVHGVALAPDLGKGYISDGKAGEVVVFDLKTLKVLARVIVPGRNPDAIVYEPISKRVLTFEGGSHDAAVIDARRGEVVATAALPGKPEFAAVDGKGRVFVNIEDKSELVELDAKKAEIVRTTSLSPCESPSGLSIDAKTERLFVGCHNKVMAVVDADTGKVVAVLPIGAGVDATAFDAGARRAFSSNGDGTLTVVREDGPNAFSVAQNAVTQKGARTMALDTETHDVYLVTADLRPADAKGGRPKPIDGTFRILKMSIR